MEKSLSVNKFTGFNVKSDGNKKGGEQMSVQPKPLTEKGKKILETFGKVIPDLSELEKEKLLAFGEGMAYAKERQKGVCDATDTDSRPVTDG